MVFLAADFYPKLRETGVTQTLIKLIKEKKLNPQSCYNAMAYLEALSSKGRSHAT
jgi:hypothetical protein